MVRSGKKPEIIAIASGKGGTGKTLIAACLGNALSRSGLKTLMIDMDRGTHGLSLFLLGVEGTRQIGEFRPENTFNGYLGRFRESGAAGVAPRTIHREHDHKTAYDALISGIGIYGDLKFTEAEIETHLSPVEFRAAARELFGLLRTASQPYDYVLVDTRGGFAPESVNVCALADSFIVVTEADNSSAFQDRNLFQRIDKAARSPDEPRKVALRGIIVNKATKGFTTSPETGEIDLDPLESEFRRELEREFPVTFNDTYPIPLDLEAIKAYTSQQIPYEIVPASLFSYATLDAFSKILKTVTVEWRPTQHAKWRKLIDQVSESIRASNAEIRRKIEEEEAPWTARIRFEPFVRIRLDLPGDYETRRKLSRNEIEERLYQATFRSKGADDPGTNDLALRIFRKRAQPETWGELVDNVLKVHDDTRWHGELCDAIKDAVVGDVFRPIQATFSAADETNSVYRPILYAVEEYPSGEIDAFLITFVKDFGASKVSDAADIKLEGYPNQGYVTLMAYLRLSYRFRWEVVEAFKDIDDPKRVKALKEAYDRVMQETASRGEGTLEDMAPIFETVGQTDRVWELYEIFMKACNQLEEAMERENLDLKEIRNILTEFAPAIQEYLTLSSGVFAKMNDQLLASMPEKK